MKLAKTKEFKKKPRSGTFVGTPLYVAPEMIKDNVSGFFTDYWAFGCVLYEMMVGKPPFIAETGF